MNGPTGDPKTAVISTGIGRLHLFESAIALRGAGYPIEIVTGLRPGGGGRWLRWAGRALPLGRAIRRFAARWPPELESVPVHSCGMAETFARVLAAIGRSGAGSASFCNALGYAAMGRASRRFLRGQGIFHVRSGAGRGGAIARARRLGMKVVVDQSIAHPAAMRRELEAEYAAFGLPCEFRPDDRFWGGCVLRDCLDADLLLVNSEYVRDTFLEEGYPADRLHVAYLGVREWFFGMKARYDRGTVLKLLFTGIFDLRKGARVLLEAIGILRREGYPFHLDVVGPMGTGARALAACADRSGICFHPFLPQAEMARFMADADVYVFPTLAEGSARSAMEAMAAGVPVITTRQAGIPADHEASGWIVPSRNVDAVVEAIRRLGEDGALRERLGRNAARVVREQFTWADYARAVMAGYAKVLAPGSHADREDGVMRPSAGSGGTRQSPRVWKGNARP